MRRHKLDSCNNVLGDPTLTISADNNEVCEGAIVTLSSTVSGGTGTTLYQWEIFNLGTGWEPIPGATSDTYITSSLTAGTYQYNLSITQDAGCEITNITNSGNSIG